MMDVRANQNLTISVQPIGAAREPLLIIDDFLEDPDALVHRAIDDPNWAEVPPGGYPGARTALPRAYVQSALRRLDPILQSRIFKARRKLARFECAFSRVTRAPEALTPLQRVPHIDVASADRVAILHYLCGPPHGGTAFFRQDRTGLERVPAAHKQRYLAARQADLAALNGSQGYADDTTSGYTQIGAVDARFNRLVIYRSCLLHSGIIRPVPPSGPNDPGRLTANFFVDYAPA